MGAPSAKTGTFDTGAAAAAAEKPKSSGQPNGLSNAERQKLRREVSSLERKMETQRARVEEAEAAMAQVDPTNYTALGEQQAKIDEAHAPWTSWRWRGSRRVKSSRARSRRG